MIFTFYSYKGGVGRSMALANVAQWLYLQGARVVMIDWDLEAPGLESYFFQSPADLDDARTHPGLVDLLSRYKLEFQRRARRESSLSPREIFEVVMADPNLPKLPHYLQQISGPSASTGGALWLLSAGARRPDPVAAVLTPTVASAREAEEKASFSAEEKAALRAQLRRRHRPGTGETSRDQETVRVSEYSEHLEQARSVIAEGEGVESATAPSQPPTFSRYAQVVQEFDWKEFFASFEGETFVDWVRVQLLGGRDADHEPFADVVLIDSRTGVTEMSGVCTRLLADVVVAFCASNRQNLDGSAKMAQSFRRPDILARRGDKPEVLLVPSRIDDRAETEDRLRFQGEFERQERAFPTQIFRFQENLPLPSGDQPRAASPAPRYSFWTLQIPYFAKFSYHEALTFPAEQTRGRVLAIPELQAVYARLGAYLVAHAPAGSGLRRKLAGALKREVPDLVLPIAMSQWPDESGAARTFQERCAQAGMPSAIVLDHGAGRPSFSAIAQSRALLVLLTPQAAQSEDLRQEIRFARQHGKVVALLQCASPPVAWHGPELVYAWNEVDRLISDLSRARDTEPAPNTTPPLPAHYVERSDLLNGVAAEVQGAVTHAPQDVVLWGLAGSGKTILAQAVSHLGSTYDAYPDGILWISMGERPRLVTEFSRLYHALTGETIQFQQEDEGRARLVQRLRGRRALWVVDDLWRADDLRRLPEPDKGIRLITTRDRDVARDVNARIIVVSAMTPKEATALLGESGSSLDKGALETLAARAEHWPLLLGLMRDALGAALGRGETPEAAVAGVERVLTRHGVVGFDPWVSDAQKLSTSLNLGGSLRRLGTYQATRAAAPVDLARYAMAALTKLGAAAFESWTPSEDGPTESERRELLRRLSDLALIETDSGGAFVRLNPWIARFLEAQGVLAKAQETPPRRHIASAADRSQNEDVQYVLSVLRATDRKVSESAREVRSRIGRLKAARYFGYARQYLALARQNPALVTDLGVWLGQQHALCTYKDPDLPADARLDRALAILEMTDPLALATSQETLGIAGAIHKAKWALDGQRVHLERSLAYYRRGYEQGVVGDHGYTAINAAYVLDLLAGAGAEGGDSPRTALRTEANRIRAEVVTTLRALLEHPQNAWLGTQWWFLVTLAEACFGLGRDPAGEPVEAQYEESRYWMREALLTDHADWEYESTVRQLASLARWQHDGTLSDDVPAVRTLRVLLGDEAALESVQIGKVGLALSGGGFRASLFHIGVLAKLAEMDLLRRVEVLSCVSGGSIIGAHYYLEARQLLQSKTDREITREDYVDIVRRIEHDFLAGVQTDLRTRLLSEVGTNLRSAFVQSDAQTRRLGELFETHIFSRARGDANGTWELILPDLVILPKDARSDFTPKLDNWRRRAKIPILVLNATTLNTGHNWQFTARWMGEPPANVNADIDVNDRLPRMYYDEAPEPHRRIRLGHAVAASAAVPMLFSPLRLAHLYERHEAVQLTDGGVHDNQGVASLLEQDCAVLLVSDASGQLRTDRAPSTWRLFVGKRSNDVLMERVRGSEYQELQARQRSGLVQGLVFVHLTKDLEATTVPWIASQEPPEPPDDPARPPAKTEEWQPTAYQVPRGWQRRLARIRTDLDAFSDQEAYALMWSGYQMTGSEIHKNLPRLAAAGAATAWRFLTVKKALPPELDAALDLGERQFGKVWRVSAMLRSFVLVAALLLAIDLAWLWLVLPSELLPLLALGPSVRTRIYAAARIGAGLALFGAVLSAGIGVMSWRLGRPIALWLLLATLGPALKVYRRLVRPLYLERGAIEPVARRGRGRVGWGMLVIGLLGAGAVLLFKVGTVPPW